MKETWGDGHGNRVDRFLAGVAYLDGERPSIVMCRGYYTRAVLAAWDFRRKRQAHAPLGLRQRPSENEQCVSRPGQPQPVRRRRRRRRPRRDRLRRGVIDDNGKGLYSTGWGHGDAMHVSDLDPANPGLEMFDIQERFGPAGHEPARCAHRQAAVHHSVGEGGRQRRRQRRRPRPRRRASTSTRVSRRRNLGRRRRHERHVRRQGQEDSSRAGPRVYPATSPSGGTATCCASCSTATSSPSGTGRRRRSTRCSIAHDCTSNNGTKATPALSADLFGDWREEVIWRTSDNQRAAHLHDDDSDAAPHGHADARSAISAGHRLAERRVQPAAAPELLPRRIRAVAKEAGDPLYARLRRLKLSGTQKFFGGPRSGGTARPRLRKHVLERQRPIARNRGDGISRVGSRARDIGVHGVIDELRRDRVRRLRAGSDRRSGA